MKSLPKIGASLVVILISTVGLLSPSLAQQHKLVQFQMAIMKKGPKWDKTKMDEGNAIVRQHLANVVSLLDSGKAVIAGPFGDDTDLAGIFILRAASIDEAKSWIDADPAVKAGFMVGEIHPWWSEDIFKKGSTPPLQFEKTYFGFLKRGPNRKSGDDNTPEIQALQKAHIANIVRLADMKKLVVAGPFGGDGDLRGIFVFRVASLKEAQDLSATDPMIKIDRLRIELHPWNVPAGFLP